MGNSRVERILRGDSVKPLSRVELLLQGGSSGSGGGVYTSEEKQKILKYGGSYADPSSLPSLETVVPGTSFNVLEGGMTTSDFVEGPGKAIEAGSDIMAVNIGTTENPIMKWNLLGGEAPKPLTNEQMNNLLSLI